MGTPATVVLSVSRRGAAACCVLALLGVASSVVPLGAADSGPKATSSQPPGASSLRDLQLEMRARRLLREDEELAPFNLGVDVRDGHAVIWGPVLSRELTRKAVKKVEQVQGVFSVRSEMYVSSDAGKEYDPGFVPRLPESATRSESALPDRATGTLPPFAGRLAAKLPAADDLRAGPSKGVALLEPVELPDAGALGADGVTGAVERVRQGDKRYRLIRYEVRGGAIYLSGAAQPESVMAFAKAVATIPGIERVVLKSQ